MFVEGEVEIQVKDKSAAALDEHNLKLWVQRSFRDMSCYRISKFQVLPKQTLRAVVALKTDVLPEADRKVVETAAPPGTLRTFMERMFEGKGTLRCVSEPVLKPY